MNGAKKIMKVIIAVLVFVGILLLLLVFSFGGKKQISLPAFFYVAAANTSIFKVNPRTGEKIHVYESPEMITWRHGLESLDNKKLLVAGSLKNHSGPAIVDLETKKLIPVKGNAALFFKKYNTFAVLKNSAVFLVKNMENWAESQEVAQDYNSLGPYLLKMNENEFGFCSYDKEKNSRSFIIYNLESKSLRSIIPSNEFSAGFDLFRSKTSEFISFSEKNHNIYLISENGGKKAAPQCMSEIKNFNEFIYYDPILDQVYFTINRFGFDFEHGPHEARDLYIYDFNTDQCIRILKDFFAKALVTSSVIEEN
ncbi:MAG: hypothetical protein H7A33_00480 [Deltaproteobacteria bacterium]|nr:hypothetical protein [Deltaproteobacteria bacterium]